MEIYREQKSQHELIFVKDNSPTLYNAVSSVSILMVDDSPHSDSSLISSNHNRLSTNNYEVIDDRLSTKNFASQGDVIYGSQSQNQNQQ